jgi:hypothetical protein
MWDTPIRRPRELGALESLRTGLGRAAVSVVSATVALAGLLFGSPAVTASDAGPGGDVAFSGQVIERETGKPVGGAEIVLERSIRGSKAGTPPAWAGTSIIRTDAQGKFRVEFPAEQVAKPRLFIAVRISHPEFISRKSSPVAVADLIREQASGETPFFTTIALERGLEYTGQVVVPGDKPAAGIPFAFEHGTSQPGPIIPPIITDDYEGQTNDDGRIRMRMPKTHALALYVGPPRIARARFPFAPYQHFWGTAPRAPVNPFQNGPDRPPEQPEVWAPTDLGQIVLAHGIRLSGRLLDTAGRPIAGQTIIAYPLKGRDRHSTTTEADGTFALGPLRPANYLIYGEGQSPYFDRDPDAPADAGAIRAVHPARVYLKEGASPEPLELRELPTFRVELRFVDSKGKPTRGTTTMLCGLLAEDPLPPGRGRGPVSLRKNGTTSAINAPEREDPWEPTAWNVQDQSDDDGRIVFHVPQGLHHAFVTVLLEDHATAFKRRIDPKGPILPIPPLRLDVVDGERQLTIIAFRAPTVLVSVKTEDGAFPEQLGVTAQYTVGSQLYGSLFVRQPDGRFRSQSLMPDHEYAIKVLGTRGVYERAPVQRISVPESETVRLSFLLRKPKPLAAGQTAPPFAVTTIAGQALSLASLHGKTVLLHFWQAGNRVGILDGATLLAIHERFGSNKRFTMVGFCLSDRSEEATRVIQSVGLSWPQALLRDEWNDPIAINYNALENGATCLIGPDGKLIARGLQGTALEKAVAEALAGK